MVTSTPWAGSRPASTKQKFVFVRTPVPSTSEHLTCAGSVLGGAGGAGLAGVAGLRGAGWRGLVDWRSVGAADSTAHTIRRTAARMLQYSKRPAVLPTMLFREDARL